MNINKPNDNKNMGQIDYGIFYTLCILLSIGVIMVYSASHFMLCFIIMIACISLKDS